MIEKISSKKQKLWWEIELDEQKFARNDIKVVINDPKTYLLNVVSACLLQETKYYEEGDEKRILITQALVKVAETEPEFICQLGIYVRNELYIRTTSNYIAAFCAVHEKTKPYIEKYFNKIVLLPNDLLETCEFAQILYVFEATEFCNLQLHRYLDKDIRKHLIFKKTLQRCVKSKFLEFNDYQLGKYCTDSQRKKKAFNYLQVSNPQKWNQKRALKKLKLNQKIKSIQNEKNIEAQPDEIKAQVPQIQKKIVKRGHSLNTRIIKPKKCNSMLKSKYMTFKDLIKFCHIFMPNMLICKILGKKYPMTSEDYYAKFSPEEGAKEPFDESKAGKRMKIDVSVTWETELSSKGNTTEIWEDLITKNKLPYLALLRNLSNILKAGVSDITNLAVIRKLEDNKAIENSKIFPLQYFNAINAVNDSVTIGFKLKKQEDQPLSETLESVKNFVKKEIKQQQIEEEKALEEEQYIKVNPETGKLYIQALENAIKIAVNKNLDFIEGHTVIFADVSSSMKTPISGKTPYGSISTCLDCAIVLGLMIKQRSEKSTFYIFSSPGIIHEKNYIQVDLPGDELKLSYEKILEEKEKLGSGTDFPYECIEEWITNNTQVDNIVLLSDMMIASNYSDIQSHGNSIVKSIKKYKKKVNPNLKVFSIDLESKGKCLNLGEEFNDQENYFKIFGMSDSILKFLSAKRKGTQNQVEYVVEYSLQKIVE